MRFWLFVFFIYLTADRLAVALNKRSIAQSVIQSGESALASAAEVVKDIPLVNKLFSHCVEPPLECPNRNVTFWYYSRSKIDSPLEISVSKPESFNQIPRNQDPWKFIIHGFTKSKDEIPNPELRSAYFKHGDYNLISVDYEPIARDGCYISGVHNVPLVAKCTAQIIDTLIDKGFFTSDTLHVIGFSLGAQVAGRLFEHMTHPKPRRVTGLDPASPLFDGKVRNNLSPEAANFVDVIHTNGLAKGKIERSGHIDFYANGGFLQPGCIKNDNTTYSTCNHNRGPLYFAESINSLEGFWGIPCDSSTKFFSGNCNTDEKNLVLMGEYVPMDARGEYYFQTTNKEPFALGRKTKAVPVV